jgi:hypothetical protein
VDDTAPGPSTVRTLCALLARVVDCVLGPATGDVPRLWLPLPQGGHGARRCVCVRARCLRAPVDTRHTQAFWGAAVARQPTSSPLAISLSGWGLGGGSLLQ